MLICSLLLLRIVTRCLIYISAWALMTLFVNLFVTLPLSITTLLYPFHICSILEYIFYLNISLFSYPYFRSYLPYRYLSLLLSLAKPKSVIYLVKLYKQMYAYIHIWQLHLFLKFFYTFFSKSKFLVIQILQHIQKWLGI